MRTLKCVQGLLFASVFVAATSQAAPMLNLPSSGPAVAQPLTLPDAPGLEKLAGNEFTLSPLTLFSMKTGNGPEAHPSKPGQKVSEPNGLYLLALGVFSMGALRLRMKNQSL